MMLPPNWPTLWRSRRLARWTAKRATVFSSMIVARLVVGERAGDQVRLVELGGGRIVGGGQHEGARLGRNVLEGPGS